MRGLLDTTIEDFLRVATLICILLNMRFIRQVYQIGKQNRTSIALLESCVRKARLSKAIEVHNIPDMADALIDPKTDGN